MSPEFCIFCAILAGDAPAEVVVDEPDVLVIRDIAPAAPVHLVAIARRHLTDLEALEESDHAFVGAMLAGARRAAAAEGLLPGGYRLVANVGEDGGNTVAHLHFHVLGGRPMGWPPG